MTFESKYTEVFKSDVNENAFGACFSPDDIGYVKVISNAVTSSDRNHDGITTKEELGKALSTSSDNCQSKVLKTSLDNFDQLTNLAPDGLGGINLADSPLSDFKAVGENVFVDRRSNSSGISLKDLEVAEMVVDKRKSNLAVADFQKAVNSYRETPFTTSLATGMAGGFLSMPQTMLGRKPTLISLGITGAAVAAQLVWGAYRLFNYQSEVPEVQKQIDSRKQMFSNMRLENNSK